MIYEPRWKSFIVETTIPVFNPKQCQMIIDAGRSQPKKDAEVGNDKGVKGSVLDTKTRTSHISWIPFKKMTDMYTDIEKVMKQTNGNHFGFDGMTITEPAQYTEYPEGGFYDWHIDNNVSMQHEPPVRKISMTLLLSPESEFVGECQPCTLVLVIPLYCLDQAIISLSKFSLRVGCFISAI